MRPSFAEHLARSVPKPCNFHRERTFSPALGVIGLLTFKKEVRQGAEGLGTMCGSQGNYGTILLQNAIKGSAFCDGAAGTVDGQEIR